MSVSVVKKESSLQQAPSINNDNEGVIVSLYVAKESGAPMESIPSATLVTGVGIEGDRYALNVRKGTYSGRFMSEPGRNLTMVSLDAIQERLQQLPKEHAFTMDKLRRNVVVQGLSAHDLNDMVGRQVRIGNDCRLFVHRRNVPCKYRQAQTKCPNFMNTFWEDCGVCCEILQGGTIRVGDTVSVIPHTYQPKRCNVGLKPHAFFVKPADRSLADVQKAIIPIPIAIALCLWDPWGFEQVEVGYQKEGQHFWTPRAYQVGMFVKTYLRTPLILALSVGAVSIVMGATGSKAQPA